MRPEEADSSILVAAVAAGITVKRFWRSYTVIDRLTLKSTARRRIPADLRADHAASTDDVAFSAQADRQPTRVPCRNSGELLPTIHTERRGVDVVMAQDELDHLLEAFAADRLTPEERAQLHAAAMRDKRLLCALADEEALKEVLRDPVLRADLLLELQSTGGVWRHGKRWWRRPWMWIAVVSALSVVGAILIGTELYHDRTPEQPLRVEREASAPTSSAVATAPESNPVTPVPNDDVPSPSAILDKPDADGPAPAPAPRRIPAPFTGPMIEERVRDDEIRVPLTVPPKLDPERPAPKKSDSLARSRTNPAPTPEPGPHPPETAHNDAVLTPAAEPASPAQHQAALPTPSASRSPGPQVSSPRTVFYGKPDHLASAAALHSHESDQTSGLETEHEPLLPSALPAPLAIRYSLVIAGPDGTDHEVDAETPVSLSDRPRLAVQTNQDGYLLVTEVASTAETAIAPPAASKPVHARTTVIFPLAGLITDPEANPVLRLRLAFTPRPPDPRHLLTQTPGSLQEERVKPAPGGPVEHAVYVAPRGASGNTLLIVELNLSQRR